MAVALLLPWAIAQDVDVPKDTSNVVMNKVDQEHKATRKFFSDELTRQRQEFFKMMDDRANYYEDTADNMLTTTAWKLGLLWGGIVFVVVGLTSFLKVKLEKKRHQKLKQSLKEEITTELLKEQKKTQEQIDARKKQAFQQSPEAMKLRQKIAQEQAQLKATVDQYNKMSGGTLNGRQ